MKQSEQDSEAVYTDTITVLLRKAVGTLRRLITLNCSYDRHWGSLYRSAWVDSQRSATSLYLVHLELSPAPSQTPFQHHRACLCCCSGQWRPPPPSPITSGERKRDVSAGLTSKGKKKRSGRALPQTTLVE